MIFSLPIAAGLALLPFISAQATDVDIKTIEAYFQAARIDFSPDATLTLNYGGIGTLKTGQKVTKEQVNSAPTVTVTPEGTNKFEGLYTLAMIDLDIVGADCLCRSTGTTVNNATATAITPYAGPWPAAGSGPHRYVVVLYEQPTEFTAPEGFTGTLPVGVYDFKDYAEKAKLGNLVAANFIEVEEGTATVSLVPTSTVNTATITASTTKAGTSTTSSGAGASPTAASNNQNGAISLAFSPIAAVVLAGLTFITL
ncbi:phosphatidylethanolamine-binding protein [Ephemerocybe angulata]|uniref:Phosphatidylethanolamine-binding protein n=1 Tax=Ephemerocybe angulata TaxID=980116 RepID=A0A8H6IH61_9AGAR|nr:phosphatidylethanolamine-binding protein [Tulosesus angulatus]